MKKHLNILLVCILITFGWASCEKFEDSNLDFSNSQPQYVELSSGTTIQSISGEEVSITVRVRENINTDVKVEYEVTGDISAGGSVIILEGDLSASILVSIPMALTSGMVEVKLTGVDNGLQLGRGGPNAGLSAISRQIVW